MMKKRKWLRALLVATVTLASLGLVLPEAQADTCISTTTHSGEITIVRFTTTSVTETCFQTWKAPANVNTVSILVVGGGGGGGFDSGGGGGGGGSAYSARTSVTPSTSYSIKVGRSGAGGILTSKTGTAGESSEALSHIGNGGSGGGGCTYNGAAGNCQGTNNGVAGGSASGGATNTTGATGGNGFCATSTGAGCANASAAATGGAGTTRNFGAISITAGSGGGGTLTGIAPAASTGGGGQGGASDGVNGVGQPGAAGTVIITYARNICSPTQTAPTSSTTRVTFTQPGRCVWQVPTGVTSISIEVVGGGGGGGYDSGGGGGGGAYSFTSNVSVTAGETSTMVIGSGGDGGVSTRRYGIDGTPTIFRGITANGGGGGIGCSWNGTNCQRANVGGAGGTVTGSTGSGTTANTSGLSGGYGFCQLATGATTCSGQGFGQAVSTTLSRMDSTTAYSKGGDGGGGTAANGIDGRGYGGTGGGGNLNGSAGGNGRVVIQFTVSECAPTSYISNDGNKRILRFTNVNECLWTVPSTIDSVTVLVVGAGGGGGYDAGGGGGGGGVILRNSFTTTPSNKILVRIGRGGSGAANSYLPNDENFGNSGSSGEQTLFGTLTAPGGGGGGGKNAAGQNGASGGGAGHAASPYPVGGSGTFTADVPSAPVSAFSGANSNNAFRGTGGGGATAAGASGGAGGAGYTSAISETSTIYGGGGGAGVWNSTSSSASGCSTGGTGGTSAVLAGNGAANTGCGGGGGGTGVNTATAGNGADGVVFVTFLLRTQTLSSVPQPSSRAWNNSYTTALKAISNKGDSVTATSATASICTVNGSGTLTMLTPGLCTITYSDSGTVEYKSVTQSYSFQVVKATPTFANWTLAGRTYSAATFTIETPTSTSSPVSPGTFSLTSETTSVLTISGTTGTMAGVGTTNIRAAFTPTNTTLWETATVVTSLVVSKSNRSISFATTTLSKTYGDSTFSVTATPSIGAGDGVISYTKAGSACSVASDGTVTILAAGSCSISATISSGSNYDTATTSIPVAVTVGQKALSISGSSIASKVYDGTRNAGTLTVGTLSGLLAGETLTVTGALSLLSSANADTYTVTATYTLGDGTGGLAANYSLGTQSLQSVVTKKTLTVTASSPTVAYGDNAPSITFEYSGFVGSENSTFVSTQPTCTTTYTNRSNYGSAPSTSCSGATATNYTISYVSGSVTITRVNLTITASSHTLNYGDAVPTFTFTISGFKNSETSSVLSTLPTCATTNYSNTSPTGTYYSRCSGAAATNYTFSYVDGSITVNVVTRSVSLTLGSATLIYGDTTTATFSMTGNQSDGSLALTVTSGSCQITGSTIRATAGTGSCVVRATASGAVSYSDTFTALTISLSPKPLTITGTTIASRVYNGTATRGTITAGTISGYVGSDSLNVTAAALDYSGSNVGTYSTTVQYTLISTAQGTSSNYSLASQSISGQITAKALTVTAPSLSRHFSQALPASLTPTITGFVNSETTSALSSIPTCTTTYTITSIVGSAQSTSCSGGVATNYTFTYVSGVVTVTTLVRTIEVTSNKSSMVYGESATLTVTPSIGANDGIISISITGSGCTFGADSSTVTAIDPNNTCTIDASITGGLNYNDATATPLAISLTKKNLTISGLSTRSKTYDGTLLAPVSGGSLVGLINSDSVTVTTSARFADKIVGRNKPVTAISTISGAAAAKYNLIQPTLPGETITAATVNVAGLTVRSRPANGSRVAVVDGTPTLTGIIAGDTVSLINFNQGLFETSTVGESITVTISMSLSGTDSNNYTLNIPTYRASISIAYDNTITFAPISNLPIGSAPFVLVASTTSGLQISFALTGSACSISGETVTMVALGECSITASQAGTLSIGGTVPAATSITRVFTVTTRAITITAEDKTHIVGGSAKPTYKISGGLISGDRINSVTIRFSGSGLSNSSTAPTTSGSYSIVVSNAVFANSARACFYTITYTPGSLVIFETTSKELTNLKVLKSGGSTADLLESSYSNSTNSYSLRVDYAISSVLITMARPNSTNVNVQVRVNESGWRTLKWSSIVGGTTDSGVLPLPAATNTIALRLYGSDKELDSQTRVISILIYRDQASRPVPNSADTSTAIATFTDRINEATIPAAAAVSAIAFTPNINFGLFNPNVDSYTATVARRISAISLTTNFTGNGITVKISVNNGPQKAIPQSGKSETYALAVGSNTVIVRATSPDGSVQQYLFTITRASS
jgi:hypothetical protein